MSKNLPGLSTAWYGPWLKLWSGLVICLIGLVIVLSWLQLYVGQLVTATCHVSSRGALTRSKTSQRPQPRLKFGDKLCTSSSKMILTPAHVVWFSASATTSYNRAKDTDAVDRQGRTDAQSQKAALR